MDMTLNAKVGSRIKLARVRAGLTQKQLGEQLGKSGAAIAYLEQGKRRISPDVLNEIAQVTDRPLSFFYEEKEASGPASNLSEQITDLRCQLEEVKSALGVKNDESCSAFLQASDGMIMMDTEGRVIDVNHRYVEMMGWKREEVKGKAFWEFDFFPEEKMPQLKSLFQDTMKTKEVHERVRMSITTKDGSEIDVEIGTSLLVRDNEPWGMLNALRPVETAVDIDQILPEA